MIDNLRELNNKVNDFVNFVVKHACENTTSGQYYVSVDDACAASGMSYEDFLLYKELIVTELYGREELLEFDFDDQAMEFDVNCGLKYCPAYHWIDGDEEIFECSFDEWLEKPAEPVSQPLSLSRMAELGEKAIVRLYEMEAPEFLQETFVEELGFTEADAKAFGLEEVLGFEEDAEPVDAVDRKVYPIDYFRVGKWNLHIVPPGRSSGAWTNSSSESFVEFWDMSDNPDLAARVRVSVFLVNEFSRKSREAYCEEGLLIESGDDGRGLTGEEYRLVSEWLKNRPLHRGERYSWVCGDVDLPNKTMVVSAPAYIKELVETGVFSARAVSVEEIGSYTGKGRVGTGCFVSFETQVDPSVVLGELDSALKGLSHQFQHSEKVVPFPSLESVLGQCEEARQNGTQVSAPLKNDRGER